MGFYFFEFAYLMPFGTKGLNNAKHFFKHPVIN